MGLTVNKTIMTTDEIKLLLAATDKRIAELIPEQEKLWLEFKTLEAKLEKLSLPTTKARDAWHEVFAEVETLIATRARYRVELAKEGATA